MCNGLGCTALGFKGDVHWMSQARKVAEGRTDRGAPSVRPLRQGRALSTLSAEPSGRSDILTV